MGEFPWFCKGNKAGSHGSERAWQTGMGMRAWEVTSLPPVPIRAAPQHLPVDCGVFWPLTVHERRQSEIQ